MKTATSVGALLGLALLVALVVRADIPAMVQTWNLAGWPLLWLIPYRGLYFLMYAIGWLWLLHPVNLERRVGLGYVFWVTTVREAVDRLLPVASIGGSIVGVRLVGWRGLPVLTVSATVIAEIVVTLLVSSVFAAWGLALLVLHSGSDQEYRGLLLALLLSLPVPIVSMLLLRYGSVFSRLERSLSPLVGVTSMSDGAAELDRQLRRCVRRARALSGVGALQLVAFVLGTFEVWFALKLFGHPVGVAAALILESMTLAVRHVAFIIPAGLGVQEAGLVLFGHALGLSSDLALCLSMAKRMREVLCGLPSLLSWQWMEARRARGVAGTAC